MANFNATSGTDTLAGTGSADTFTFTNGTGNAGDTFNGAGGADSLVVATANAVDFRNVGNQFTSIERLTLNDGASATFGFTQLNGSIGALPTTLAVTGGGSAEAINIEMSAAGLISFVGWTFTS